MTPKLTIAAAAVCAVCTSSSAEAASADQTPVALAVSPARVALVAPAARAIELRNLGTRPLTVEIARKQLDGRATAKNWIAIRPARLVLRARAQALVTMRVRRQSGAGPGDHQLLVLVVARPLERSRVAVRVRLGIGVRVRVPGRLVRHLEVQGLRVRRHQRARMLLLGVANGGNVIEPLRSRVTVTLIRDGKFVSRLRPSGPRQLLPGTHAVLAMAYTGRTRGPVTAVVRVRLGGRLRLLERRYRIRL